MNLDKNVFRVNQKVFDYFNGGWGEILSINDKSTVDSSFKIKVYFHRLKKYVYYNEEGRWSKNSPRTLSTTEYTLNNFTQTPPINKYNTVYVCNEKDKNIWYVRIFARFEFGKIYTFENGNFDSDRMECWNHWRIEKPKNFKH